MPVCIVSCHSVLIGAVAIGSVIYLSLDTFDRTSPSDECGVGQTVRCLQVDSFIVASCLLLVSGTLRNSL
jgi:hypothetical protein